jgi:hypothetical protein
LKHSRFIIQMPNGTELLVSTNNGWAGLVDFIKYFNTEYDSEINIRPVSFWQSLGHWFGKKYVVKNRCKDGN